MKRLAAFVIRFRYWFLAGTLLLVLASAIMFPFVRINYDFTKYLPEDMGTKQALKVMEEEFGIMGQASIMIENITIDRAINLKQTLINNNDGILDILWLDTFVEPDILLEFENVFLSDATMQEYFADIPGVNQFYKNRKVLFQVVFKNGDYSDVTDQTITDIREYLNKLDYKYAMAGSAVSTYHARHATEKEVFNITIFVLPIFLMILFIFTTSFLEPFLFIIVIGAAVVINMGTNLIFGEISFFTHSTATLLQFAVSMDYAIFLLHRYHEEKEHNKGDNVTALKNALSKSYVSILSSSLTTVAGFAALLFMRYSIGIDLALVMIKGVLLSIVCVFVFMPSLILLFDKGIEKTRHRLFAPKLLRLSDKAFRYRIIVPIIAVMLVYPTYIYQNNNKFLYGNSAMESGEGSEAAVEIERIEKEFGNTNMIVLLLPHVKTDGVINIEETKKAEFRLIDDIKLRLKNLNIKANVQSYYQMTDISTYLPKLNLPETPETKKIEEAFLAWLKSEGYGRPEDWIKDSIPPHMEAQLLSPNYSRIIISVQTSSESEEAFNAVRTIKASADELAYQNYYLLGVTPSVMEIKEVVESDFVKVNLLSIIAVLIILIFSFKSLILPFILVFVIELSIWINMSIPNLMNQPLIFIGYMIVSSIQLGATIDYAILLTGRYLDNRKSMNKKRAMMRSIVNSGNSILTSSLIMASAGFILALISSVEGVSAIGSLIGRGALLSALLVLIFLPQLLYFFDPWISKMTMNIKFWEGNGQKP
jgi:predicted RND superfamily exporter protein